MCPFGGVLNSIAPVEPLIDVVIPVFGHYELTNKCLEHLRHQTAVHRAIVVDDGSHDDTRDSLSRDWPDVHVVQLDLNVGYTGAVNRGVEAGDGKYIVLLNNDVELHPHALNQMIRPMEADDAVGSVATLMLRPGEQAIDSLGVTADATLAGFARLQGHPPAHAFKDGPVLTGPEGTAGAYRREAWEQVGGLDETITAYMEILDLALRLRTAGWKTAAAPEAVGIHLGSRTYGRHSASQRRLAGFSRGYLLRRYGVLRGRAAPRALLTELAVVLADLLLCRDLEALRGRLEGWRTARGKMRHTQPPDEAIDWSISLLTSFKLRQDSRR
jgi:N-acetylglucosaminyl-diphospho-decaprenol L-rhamnosyltransferase